MGEGRVQVLGVGDEQDAASDGHAEGLVGVHGQRVDGPDAPVQGLQCREGGAEPAPGAVGVGRRRRRSAGIDDGMPLLQFRLPAAM